MKAAASHVMASPLQGRSARPIDRHRRPFVVAAAGNQPVRSPEPRRQVLQGVQGALLAAVLATGIGLAPPAELMPAAHAEMSAPERRKLEAQQRRELLAKAREDALKKGGSEASAGMDAATTEPAPAPGPSAADTKVEAANAAVEESNQTRQGLSASMMERLKKASGEYEKQAAAGLKLPKEREAPQPSWLQQFTAPKEEPAPAAGEAPAPAAPAQQQPLQLPKVDVPRLEAPKLEAPKLEAPRFEAPQLPKLPSWGSTNALEAAPAPVPPSKPAPAPAAKVELPSLPFAPKEPPAPKAQAPHAPAVDSDPGGYLRSLLDSPSKPGKAPEAPKAEAPKLFEKKEAPKPELPTKSAAAAVKEAAKLGKRKGPLPLWLAEIFVIGGLSGILYAIVRWNEEIDAVWRKVSSQAEAAYDRLIPTPKA